MHLSLINIDTLASRVICVLLKLFHETKVGDFESAKFETKQVFYKSKDGTEIPMFIINKKVTERT